MSAELLMQGIGDALSRLQTETVVGSQLSRAGDLLNAEKSSQWSYAGSDRLWFLLFLEEKVWMPNFYS